MSKELSRWNTEGFGLWVVKFLQEGLDARPEGEIAFRLTVQPADYWHKNEAVRDLWEAKAARMNAAAGVIPFTLRQTTGFRAFIAPEELFLQLFPPDLPFGECGLNARKALWKAMTKQEQNEWYEEHKQPTIQAMAAPALFLISQESAGPISGLPRGVLEIIAIHMVRWEDEVKKLAPKELQTEKLVDA